VWFIGAPVSLAAEDDDLVPARPDLVATRPGDRHLTLAFLGPAPDEHARALWSSLPPVVLPDASRALRWERLGRSAIALEVSDDDRLLTAAAAACYDAADGLIELVPPSPFRPHVTMARVPRRSRPPSSRVLSELPLPSSALEVGSLTLFRTRTQREGDRYERVEQRPTPAP
jgi:2'-5' RNA ligase